MSRQRLREASRESEDIRTYTSEHGPIGLVENEPRVISMASLKLPSPSGRFGCERVIDHCQHIDRRRLAWALCESTMGIEMRLLKRAVGLRPLFIACRRPGWCLADTASVGQTPCCTQ